MDRIVEVKTTLSGRVEQFECLVAQRSAERLVVIYRFPAARAVHCVWLPEGGLTVGYFWRDRPYNLYHWLGPAGDSLAFYFNVGDVTQWDADTLGWHDLAVDVLATPDGTVRVLDEDELPPDLDPALRHYVESARDGLLGELPNLIRAAEAESATVFRSLSAR